MNEGEVLGLRPFVPANEFERSFAFYEALGFAGRRFTEGLALLQIGPFGFLLQQYDAKDFAQHLMMQLVVNDLDMWWERTRLLELADRFGVRAPQAPAMQPWGLRVSYVVDPTGVLWHVVENPN